MDNLFAEEARRSSLDKRGLYKQTKEAQLMERLERRMEGQTLRNLHRQIDMLGFALLHASNHGLQYICCLADLPITQPYSHSLQLSDSLQSSIPGGLHVFECTACI